jgi:hypothetical protein
MQEFTQRIAVPVLLATAAALTGCGGTGTSLPNYTIGGSVTGLGEGNTLVLQDNGGDNLSMSTDGGFTFATLLPGGTSYAVTVLTQPAGTICRVSDGTGTLAPDRSVLANPAAGQTNITNVVVTCAPAGNFTIGGNVTGLLPGNSVVLTDDGGDGTTVSANTSFTFPTQIEGGLPYSVKVGTMPPGQTCAVTNGSGMVDGTVTNVAVACSDNTYNVSAVVSGLNASTSVVLQDNGADNLTVASNAATHFNTPVASGSPYLVTVLTQPIGENCAPTGGSGTIVASNVSIQIVCKPLNYSVSGVVSGLLSSNSVVLEDNGGNSTAVASNTGFTFSNPVPSGSAYAVTAQSPAGQNCTVSNGSGTITGAAITNVAVACSDNTYNVGGSISGLTGTLVLTDNGTDTLTTTNNGGFNFNTPVASGSMYSAGITIQPSGETCTLSNGTGTIVAAAVTSISISCTANAASAAGFVWEAGPGNAIAASGGPGVYGTRGIAAAGNIPPARASGVSWTDASGNFWLFGGSASIVPGDLDHYLNDLWKYTPGTGEWTWVSGANAVQTLGVYGTQGVAAAGNAPGSRVAGEAWVDSSGNFWIFGGFGCDATSCSLAFLNDLWMFSPTTGLWTWEGGSQSFAASGVYGTLGQAAAGNFPGARDGGAFWTDLSGNLWLLGGLTYDVNGRQGDLNDLWKYSTTTKEWTWVGGSDNVLSGLSAVRGSQGQAAAGNWPGAIEGAASVTDASGNFWMFGGYQTLSNSSGPGNDVWKYSPGTGLWTCWTSGTGLADQAGSYGTEGVASSSSFPGGRAVTLSWSDASGNLWIYGGEGTESSTKGFGDLWEFSPGSGLWTWIGGSNSSDDAAPTWGTLGVPSASNFSGSRAGSSHWQDASGNFWLFSGANNDGSAPSGNVLYQDLWKITP